MDEDTKPVEETPSQDDQEWDSVTEEFAEDNGVDLDKKEEVEDEEAPDDNNDVKPEGEQPPVSDDDGDKPAGDEPVETPKEEEPTPTKADESLDPRAAYRQMEIDRKEMAADVREQLFKDAQKELTDADGDPIRTIQDVQKLQNPNTGKAFTPEEAALWLLQAQRNFEKNQAEMESKVEAIAEVNLSLKESADKTRAKYKDILAQRPELAKQIYQNYQKTLQKDPDSGVITGVTITPEEFYDTALSGYVEAAAKGKEQEQADARAEEARKEAEAKVEAEKKKHAEEIAKVRSRNDREDILSTGKNDTRDGEEKEWDRVAKEYYEG